MRLSVAKKIIEDAGFELVLDKSGDIEHEDDAYYIYKDGVKQNVHLQVCSLTTAKDPEVEGLYREGSLEIQETPGEYTFAMWHYFDDSITKERIEEFLLVAQSEEEAGRLYNETQRRAVVAKWQETKKPMDDIRSVIEDVEDEEEPVAGIVYEYAGSKLWIRDNGDGTFWVLEGTSNGKTFDNITDAENALCDFARAELLARC